MVDLTKILERLFDNDADSNIQTDPIINALSDMGRLNSKYSDGATYNCYVKEGKYKKLDDLIQTRHNGKLEKIGYKPIKSTQRKVGKDWYIEYDGNPMRREVPIIRIYQITEQGFATEQHNEFWHMSGAITAMWGPRNCHIKSLKYVWKMPEHLNDDMETLYKKYGKNG